MKAVVITVLIGIFITFGSQSSLAANRTAKSYANEASQYFNNKNTASFLQVCILWDNELPSFQSAFNLALAYLMNGNYEKANNQIAELEKQYKTLTEAQKRRLNTLQTDISNSMPYTARTYEHIRNVDITLHVKNNEDGFGAPRGGSKDLEKIPPIKKRSPDSDGNTPPTPKELMEKASGATIIEEHTPPSPISGPEMPD